MTLHTAFHFPDGRVVVNTERGRYVDAPVGFFGTEEARIVTLDHQIPNVPIPAWTFHGGVLLELVAWGLPGVWIRTQASVATTACPHCHSLPGVPCTFRGHPTASWHCARQRQARHDRWAAL